MANPMRALLLPLFVIAACSRSSSLKQVARGPELASATPPSDAAPSASAARPHLEPTHALDAVYASALAADMRTGLARLSAIPVDTLDDAERSRRVCILRRFSDSAPSPDTKDEYLARVLSVYWSYWSDGLLGRVSQEEGKARLADGLRPTLSPHLPDAHPPTLDALLDALGAALEQRGYHSIRGVTSPFQDLIVWKTEQERSYTVRLPEGERRVDVVMMREFVSHGWEGFATCDRTYPGGWAEKDKLHCVADSYELDSEDFSVSYLTHETQHFSDYEHFPKLAQPELEYRAELAEIIESAKTTRALVGRFASQYSLPVGDGRSSPHNLANGLIVRDLRHALGVGDAGGPFWESVSPESIRVAARSVFEANTRLLVAKGASTVVRVL